MTDTIVTTDSDSSPMYRVVQLVYFIGGLVEALLALRFIFQLLGANRGSQFVDFIYDLSQPLVAPFFGIFGSTPAFGIGRFEVETLVALLVYAFVTYLVARLIALIS